MNPTRTLTLTLLLAGLAGATGCNTESMVQDRQRVEGPVTDLDDPEGVHVPDIRIAGAGEMDLVEAVLTHRAMYARHLRLLHDYYREHGYEHKRRWAEQELRELNRVQPFKYVMQVEIAPERLRPVDSVAEADTMYEKALALMKEGGHGTPVFYREDIMLKALGLFVDLIEKYPTSDKIDDAAFYCGEIHKEYLKDQEIIAVRWYERALAWNPNTPHNVRFQAAVAYDFRLHDRAKALEYYKQVIDVENRDKSNVAFATKRIRQLTAMKDDATVTAQGPGDVMAGPPK